MQKQKIRILFDNIRKNIFIGIAEFDEDEGPIISKIYPSDYPLDINYLYAIADYALHLESKSLFELSPYTVLSLPFKIYSPRLPRKYKYYALIISWREQIREILHKKLAQIEQLAQTKLNVIKQILEDASRLKFILQQMYSSLIKIITQNEPDEERDSGDQSKSAIIIDRILGFVYGDISALERYLNGKKPRIHSKLSERFILIAYW